MLSSVRVYGSVGRRKVKNGVHGVHLKERLRSKFES